MGMTFLKWLKNPLGPAEKEVENRGGRCNCCLKQFFIIRVSWFSNILIIQSQIIQDQSDQLD